MKRMSVKNYPELFSLRAKDVDLEKRKLRTIGKGGKERYIPFHLTTQKALEKYFNLRGLAGYGKRNYPVFMTYYPIP
jgi:site-specific recombinase XerC